LKKVAGQKMYYCSCKRCGVTAVARCCRRLGPQQIIPYLQCSPVGRSIGQPIEILSANCLVACTLWEMTGRVTDSRVS